MDFPALSRTPVSYLNITKAGAPLLVKSDPFAQLRLLKVQDLDTAVLQLQHAKTNLPEVAQARKIAVERKGFEDQARDARIVVTDLLAAQAKADADVEAVRVRRRRDQERIDSGAVTSPKDLSAMTHEIENMDRRIGVLEDEELEIMEALDAAQETLTALETQVGGFDGQIIELRDAHQAKVADIEAELTRLQASRPELVEDMPADLLGLYDTIRQAQGGVGAGELRARKCGGCGITLDAVELTRVRSAQSTEVLRCAECTRIMVRTAESGL